MTQTTVYAVVLAAGQSERFGSAKLLADLNGRPLLHHALSAAQGACPGSVCLVVGHRSDEILDTAAGLADLIVMNEEYDSGIGSSISRGVQACHDRADAILVVLADQPLVTASHLSELVGTWTGDPDEIIASRFAGIDGPPVLFASGLFDQLGLLSGDAGARQILLRNALAVRAVEFEPASVDVDTPADIEELANRHRS